MKKTYLSQDNYCTEYMRYLGIAKTARRSYAESVRLLKAKGFKEISSFKSLKAGDKVYRGYEDRTVMAAVVGKKRIAETVPLQADSISWVERPEGDAYVNFGQTEFVIDCKAWMKANDRKDLTLVKIAEPNKAGLERLIAKASVVGKRTLPAGCLKVSDDGTAIILTAVNSGLLLFVR